MSLWLLVLLMSIGTARLTRLVGADDFPPVYWLRQRIVMCKPPHLKRTKVYTEGTGWHANPSEKEWQFWWLGELITCPWCISAYISAAFTFGYWAWPHHDLPAPFIVWFAVWGIGAIIASKIV